jgi:hypothetical protein
MWQATGNKAHLWDLIEKNDEKEYHFSRAFSKGL